MIKNQNISEWIGGADKIWHLSQAPLVKGLSGIDLQRICGILRDQIFKRGELIFDQGDKPDSLYFLNRGSVRITITNDDNRAKTLGILRGGDVFGLESIGQDGYSQIRAIAHEESWVSVLTRVQFMKIAAEQPSLYFNLIQILLRRLEDTREDLKAQCFLDIQERLVRTLLKLARSHGQKVAGNQDMVKLRLRLSHDSLADMIGSNRPYLSNIMSKLRKQGWIAYGHNHLLVNVEALKDLNGSQLPVLGSGPEKERILI